MIVGMRSNPLSLSHPILVFRSVCLFISLYLSYPLNTISLSISLITLISLSLPLPLLYHLLSYKICVPSVCLARSISLLLSHPTVIYLSVYFSPLSLIFFHLIIHLSKPISFSMYPFISSRPLSPMSSPLPSYSYLSLYPLLSYNCSLFLCLTGDLSLSLFSLSLSIYLSLSPTFENNCIIYRHGKYYIY